MADNSQEIPVLVTYYTNSRILDKKEFGSFAHFGSILNYFDKHIKMNNSQLKLKQKYFLNDKEIEDNDLLINLIQSLNKNKNKIISEATLSIEIEEEEKKQFNFSENKNISIYSKILQPKSNPFGVYVFNPKDYSIFFKPFLHKDEIDNELNKLNEYSAYCNSTKDLYISGGKDYNNNINNFWIINNESFSIKKMYMKYPKSNHSMIYINHNDKEFIFISGGDDLKSFYYDIKANTFANWGNMNYKHFRPALVHIGDYLYCFDTSEKNDLIFERTNLNDISKKWEKIIPKFEKDKLKNFTNSGFSANLCINGKILFCGGDNININTYLYDIDKNIISSNDNCEDILFTFNDKNFYKINNNNSVALPYSFSEEKEVLITNKNNYSLNKINLNKKDKNKNQNKKFIFNNKYINTQESLVGNINIEFKTEDINDVIINEENNDEINNIENIDNIENSNYSYSTKKTKSIKTFNKYIVNNDNFINYKNEKKITHCNDINIKYDNEDEDEESFKEKEKKIKSFKKHNTEIKKEIKLIFNELEDFYEPEGNNFIYDSNLNKFGDMKANYDLFKSTIININKNNKIKKDNNINKFIKNINNINNNNPKDINNIESDRKININNDNNIIDENEINHNNNNIKNINLGNKDIEKENINKEDNNSLNIIDIPENKKENNIGINNNEINTEDKQNLNINNKENEEIYEENKNEQNKEIQNEGNEEYIVEEYEDEENIKENNEEEQSDNKEEDHNEVYIEDNVDSNMEENENNQDLIEEGNFIEVSNKDEEDNNEEEENNEEKMYNENNEEEDEDVEEYKDEMEVEEKENNNEIEVNGNDVEENIEMEKKNNEKKKYIQKNRDKFQETIVQPLDKDIIQIEKYPELFYYEENNFCDYCYIPEEINF